MKRSLVTLALTIAFCISASAQNLCTQMQEKEASFNELAKKFMAIPSPSDREIVEFETSCVVYTSAFVDAAAKWSEVDHNVPNIIGMKPATMYMYQLVKSGRYDDAFQEASYCYDNLFRFIDFGDKDEIRCSKSSGVSMVMSKSSYRTIASAFLCIAIKAAFKVNKPEIAMLFFWGGIINDGFNKSGEVNEMAKDVMQYRLGKHLVDDTTFRAAYTLLNTLREERSFLQVMGSFMKFPEDDAIKVITDPKFIKYSPPEIRHGFNYYHPYPSYFHDLYEYLKSDTADLPIQHAVMKMMFKTYYANEEKGIDYIHFSNQLRCCMPAGQGGTKVIPTIEKIIAGGDAELMQLLADFIRKGYTQVYFPDEYYGAYLLYHALGDEKSAGKMFNRIEKRIRDRYVRL